jgi:hypothetical protein
MYCQFKSKSLLEMIRSVNAAQRKAQEIVDNFAESAKKEPSDK